MRARVPDAAVIGVLSVDDLVARTRL